jgi:hypothetical protein
VHRGSPHENDDERFAVASREVITSHNSPEIERVDVSLQCGAGNLDLLLFGRIGTHNENTASHRDQVLDLSQLGEEGYNWEASQR